MPHTILNLTSQALQKKQLKILEIVNDFVPASQNSLKLFKGSFSILELISRISFKKQFQNQIQSLFLFAKGHTCITIGTIKWSKTWLPFSYKDEDLRIHKSNSKEKTQPRKKRQKTKLSTTIYTTQLKTESVSLKQKGFSFSKSIYRISKTTSSSPQEGPNLPSIQQY